ncbi:beta-N-acetylglucosaminidase domain-containing protein [Selenomonas sp.]|uniref:beta-N-acetylglucosaminidase domain-containing protein n=1 Tax=Selenomonas sp. TaxID=2053611 RepID=UPI0025EA085C|nr:beta-N-acetylglucosaminidase domain-containing protein [Selenomonas sp.]MCI6284739.1 beta-N-acetylglucosaminidase domain-containing protein [Selenomonas sp.]
MNVFVKSMMMALLCVLAWSAFSRAAVAAPVPMRGVIEGFYGTPWTEAERLDIIAFCKEHGFNAYVYAPKDDLYHRERWREPYPKEELDDLAKLIAAAKADGVRFVFAVSPGLSLHLDGKDPAADRAAMLAKLESLYKLGVRDFAIFFDDIENKDGAGQAAFLNAISGELHRRHKDIGALLTVPTEYDRGVMTDAEGNATPYTAAFAQHLSKDIVVLYTGEGVAKGRLTREQLDTANALYHRQLGLWWNYPVNDYAETKLALGPMDPLPLADVPVILYNPMKYERLSKIALATGADLACDSAHYDAETSWQHAIRDQYGDLAPAMQIFADHSTHLENDWADIGRADAPQMRKAVDGLLAALDQDAPVPVKLQRLRTLDDDLVQLQAAVETLQTRLDPATLQECQPQLAQLNRIVTADRLALKLLRQQLAGTPIDLAPLAVARQDIVAHEQEAHISDNVARLCLDEIVNRL